jgi:hypothetical protein
VARDIFVGNDYIMSGIGTIGRDMYLGGSMTGSAFPPSSIGSIPSTVGIPMDIKGNVITGPVDIAPPCACGEDEKLDISGIVADARNDNQNDEHAIDQNSLQGLVGANNISLPSGRVYYSNITGSASVTLKVDGHTSVYVGGDLIISGGLTIETSDDATLDVYVAGNFQITGSNNFGKISRPSAVRVYVAGQEDVTLSGYTGFVGNLYAPNATVVFIGETRVFGSIFAGEFLAKGGTYIFYDLDVNRGGDECGENDDPGDDAVEACVPYEGKCEVDEDCCSPLVCNDGRCGALQIPIV